MNVFNGASKMSRFLLKSHSTLLSFEIVRLLHLLRQLRELSLPLEPATAGLRVHLAGEDPRRVEHAREAGQLLQLVLAAFAVQPPPQQYFFLYSCLSSLSFSGSHPRTLLI